MPPTSQQDPPRLQAIGISGTRSRSIARPDLGFGHMEEDIVDVGTRCMQPLIRQLFVSGDGWEGIEFKLPSPRQLVVQHFDVSLEEGTTLDRAPGLGLYGFQHPSRRTVDPI